MTATVEQLHRLWASPWPARVLSAALAAACALLLAQTGWLLLAGPALPESAPIAAAPALAAPPAPIAPWHLFGQGQAAPASAPASALALVLRGTFASADPKDGMAFIADAQGRERAYRPGEQVGEDAVLAEVYTDHVILRRGGQREALHLPRAGGGAGPAAVHPAPAAAAAADPSGDYLSGPLSFGRPDLATARAAQVPSLEALAAQVNLLPVSENGRLVGVRLVTADPALVAGLGIDPEEVVTAVNGIPLDAPDRRQALEASLRGEGPLVLTLRRDGRERQHVLRN